MEQKLLHTIKVSVRNLVEFILNSGDIDNTNGGGDKEAMLQGGRLHREIQKNQSDYQAEVVLSDTAILTINNESFAICVEGRADGILKNTQYEIQTQFHFNEPKMPDKTPSLSNLNPIWNALKETDIKGENQIESSLCPIVTIDEIKCMYYDVTHIKEIIPIHRAQVLCYAYIYAVQNQLDCINIRLTYCNIETKHLHFLEEVYTTKAISRWYHALLEEYGKWISWQIHWQEERNKTIKGLAFPFAYRPGQKELVVGVYSTILREKKLFIEAPTGVGKTISTIFPALHAMGEKKVSKLFYLTAKTITRTVAEDTFLLLMEKGLRLKTVTITAKEKICILEKPDCNPTACERARGHYDRVNDAVYDMLTKEEHISRDLILSYAKKHNVCPFEMSLDLTNWADVVICDYNYVFDPHVYLRRFFQNEKKQDYVFLIDEAHNLVDRAREMYSAILYKEKFLTVKNKIKNYSAALANQLEACNKDLLLLKRECEEFKVWENAGSLVIHLMRLLTQYEEFFQMYKVYEGKEEVLQLYMEVRHFLMIHEEMDENYVVYTDYNEFGEFRIKLMCMNPSKKLLDCLNKGRSAIFFSATLLPIQYYKDQLGGTKEDYAVYTPSPFEHSHRLLLVAKDVSTKYTRRNQTEYQKILAYIETFIAAKTGNYLVFFPSYQMLNQFAELAKNKISKLILQKSNMTESEKEEFLSNFTNNTKQTNVGFCVLGGIFSEGIDLTKDQLIGAVIVGTGLPMVCKERELFRGFYEERKRAGFEYAYLYPGMNKVLQAAGRVIRTGEDKGAILLLDDRFLNSQYQALFPKEWYPFQAIRLQQLDSYLNQFWNQTF